MRRQIDSKSNTCTESVDVDVTDMSVKVSAQYPGRSAVRPRATVATRRWDRTAEVSRRHSKSCGNDRRPEHNDEDRSLKFR